MSERKEPSPFGLFFSGLVLGAFVLSLIFALTGSRTEFEWHKYAIAHHAAHYADQTGTFTWNDEKDIPP